MTTREMSVKTVFDQALEIEPSPKRKIWLDQVCAGRPELRSQVEALLKSYSAAGSFLQDSPLLPATMAMPTVTEQAGMVIGPYKLLEQIGEGGMGVVYVAEQAEPFRRKVALKIIKPGMDTKQVIGRFEAERQTLALMEHPNIAKIHDAETTESGRPYFVMELVRGIPITEYCDKCQLSTRERLELLVMVCRAVQHAHQKGIIHRDLKPTNVLVTVIDGRPIPKVIDFGVAKAIGGKLTEQTVYTQFDQMIGTPLYMSPEQAEMSGVDVDTRSDVYSLGVLLYELLTGSTPFDKETMKQAGFEEMRRIIREDEPPRPSARVSTLQAETLSTVSQQRGSDLRKMNRTLRRELDWIVMKALEKDRNRRYESASALAADVERFLADEPVEACPPSAVYRFRKFVRRNKSLFTIAALLVGFLLLSTIGLGISTVLISQEHTEALRQRNFSRKNEEKVIEREATIRTYLYAADLQLAFQAYNNGDLETARRRLEAHLPSGAGVDQRGFEWHYLWNICRDSSRQFLGHQRDVFHVAFSPDGKKLASASRDRSVLIWNVADGTQSLALRDFTDNINGIDFSADGTLLATAEENRIARVWDLETAREIARFTEFAQPVAHLFFTADQQTLVAAEVNWQTNEGRISLWDLSTQKRLQVIEGFRALAVHPESQLLAACTSNGELSLWSLPNL